MIRKIGAVCTGFFLSLMFAQRIFAQENPDLEMSNLYSDISAVYAQLKIKACDPISTENKKACIVEKVSDAALKILQETPYGPKGSFYFQVSMKCAKWMRLSNNKKTKEICRNSSPDCLTVTLYQVCITLGGDPDYCLKDAKSRAQKAAKDQN